MLARLSIAWKLMLAAGCAIGALLLLAAALVAMNASGMVRNLSNQNAQALAGKAAAEVAGDLGEIQGIGKAMAQTLGAAHAAGVRDRKVLSDMAIHETEAFGALVAASKKALEYLKDAGTKNEFETAVN